MLYEVNLPSLSPTMEEGKIVKWIKKEKDPILSGEVLFEVETDKATMEVEAVDEGKITHLLDENVGSQVPVNSVIAIIDGDENESIQNLIIEKEKPKEENKKIKEDLNLDKNIQVNQNSNHVKSDDRIYASPFAKKISKEQNIDLTTINGSGPGGRIIKRDLESHENVKASNTDINFKHEVIKPSTMRKVIAKRTLEAKQQIPHFYLTIESNVGKLIELRRKINENNSVKVSFNDLIVKALAMAMKKNPNTNVYWQDNQIFKLNDIDVSVAVAIDEGLITPIVKKVNSKGLNEISKEIKELAKLAKTNSLKPEQYTGGSITVSNLGMFGISEFAAIISPPQASILAVGKIIQKPVVVNESIEIGHTLKSTLSADHRVLDGAVAGKLLKDFNDIIEDPFQIWMQSNDMEII